MKAQVLNTYDDHLTADKWVSLQEVPDPVISKSTDVIVRIGGAGVCRTDLHIIEGVWRPHMDPNGDNLLPLIMGHENAGWVEAVGKEVEGIKVGDPVIVHPKISGGTCLACRRGFDMQSGRRSDPDSLVRWTILENRWPILADHLEGRSSGLKQSEIVEALKKDSEVLKVVEGLTWEKLRPVPSAPDQPPSPEITPGTEMRS